MPWTPNGSAGPWTTACGGIDAVINLAGASIGDGRWSPARKALLVQSRLDSTRSLVRFIAQATPPPAVFISSSAVGYYGDRADEELTEDAPAGTGFLAELCQQWEAAACEARTHATRVILVRTGIVLDRNAGALPRMLLAFKLFAGGPFGSGRQYMSWIHRDDWGRLVLWLLNPQAFDGPVNVTAPNPVTNATFARTLGRALGRPAFMPAPAFALELALGEMAGPLLLSSQRVLPARAMGAGFSFTYGRLEDALANLLARNP